MIDSDAIRQLIPHSGKMSLLDFVLSYDEEGIVCTSVSHLDVENPLRNPDGLSSIHGLEYAAQAMALHGALSGASKGASYLAAVRDIGLFRDWLHDVVGPLRVSANLLARHDTAATYAFSVEAQGSIAVRGRLTGVFVAGDK
jgi:predicted hotdog family 3-hydroxylacyl-ACP dehydratase